MSDDTQVTENKKVVEVIVQKLLGAGSLESVEVPPVRTLLMDSLTSRRLPATFPRT